jgi:uncharacterized protein YndB with AHSA1/START domain
MSGTTTTTETAERELTIVRTFDAPRELVFQAWTDAEHMARWMGPEGFEATHVELDATPQGRFRTCIKNNAGDGAEYWSAGRYLEITPPERLVFSFAWEEEDGGLGNETTVTIDLVDLGGRTEMRFHQAAFVSVEDRDGHEDGWTTAFNDLAAHVEKR